MDCVSSGNVSTAAVKGWFVGHFINNDPVRGTKDVAVKWGVHPAGESNGEFTAYWTATTISVLVRGRFRLTFKRGDGEGQVLLENEGDFAAFKPGVYHAWEALEDTVILTVRWPSVGKDDQTAFDP